MFVYSLSPIDDWRGSQKPEDLFRTAIDTSPDANPTGKDDPLGAFKPHRWARAWTSARAAARKLQWKGDIRPGGGPYVTILPATEPGGLPIFVIAWKQQRNGWLPISGDCQLVTAMSIEEARARATHYRAFAEQNIGRLAYEGLLTLATAYEAYVA
jgi:hypothetical protein